MHFERLSSTKLDDGKRINELNDFQAWTHSNGPKADQIQSCQKSSKDFEQ